jgi:hypothetical protein
MTHDKIKAAARRRMAASGEPYALARREDITQHSAADSTSVIGPDDIRAAAEVHRELGSVYGDAVVASFIDKVDREVAARVEARLAGMRRPKRAKQRGPRRLLQRRVVRDAVAASAGALAVVGAIGLHGLTSAAPQSSAHPTTVHVALQSWLQRSAQPSPPRSRRLPTAIGAGRSRTVLIPAQSWTSISGSIGPPTGIHSGTP